MSLVVHGNQMWYICGKYNLNCYGTQKNAVLLMHGAEVKDISGSYHTTWQIVSTNLLNLVNNVHQINTSEV